MLGRAQLANRTRALHGRGHWQETRSRGSMSKPRHAERPSTTVSSHSDVAVEDETTTSNAELVEGGNYTVQGSIDTTASLGDVWSVLVDYPALANVFSNIKGSEVVSREPEIVLQQNCKWEFLIFSGSFKTELGVQEDLGSGRLTFNLISSSFMRHFVGQWQLHSLESGGCKVEHRLTVEPVISPPPFMSGYTQKIFVQQVASILHDLEQELDLRQSKDYDYLDL